jgi:hypothetical protein
MNAVVKNILSAICAAGISANVAVLWGFNSRLASIETKLAILLPDRQTNNQPNNQNELRPAQLAHSNRP